MHRYLLFDSGCSQCTEIAQAVEQATQGGLEARSLRDPTMQRLLAQARPHWRWQPALLEVAGDRVRAFTGLAMGLRLMGVLGLRRVWRLAKLVRRLSAPLASTKGMAGVDWRRRRFLRYALGTLGGFAFLGRLGSPSSPPWPSTSLPPSPSIPHGFPPIRRSQFLEGEARAALLQRIRSHPDLLALSFVPQETSSPEPIAVVHELADGNHLEIAAWPDGEDLILVHIFARPWAMPVVGHSPVLLQSQAMRLRVDGEWVRLVARSVNGRLTGSTRAGEGLLIQPTSHCAGCANCWTGPWETDCQSCAEWNTNCLIACCGQCVGWCSTWWTCIACIVAWCPWCAEAFCCNRWVHDCCSCGGCGG